MRSKKITITLIQQFMVQGLGLSYPEHQEIVLESPFPIWVRFGVGAETGVHRWFHGAC